VDSVDTKAALEIASGIGNCKGVPWADEAKKAIRSLVAERDALMAIPSDYALRAGANAFQHAWANEDPLADWRAFWIAVQRIQQRNGTYAELISTPWKEDSYGFSRTHEGPRELVEAAVAQDLQRYHPVGYGTRETWTPLDDDLWRVIVWRAASCD